MTDRQTERERKRERGRARKKEILYDVIRNQPN